MNKIRPIIANWRATLTCLLYIASASSLFAESSISMMLLTIKVVLEQGTCDVTGQGGSNQPITVDFEDMQTLRIDGIAYEKLIPYKITCTNGSSNPALWLSLSGDSAPFNTQLLATSDPQLGLKLNTNGKAFTPGQKINFLYQEQPSLSVTPVIGQLAALIGGGFTATATLSVNYQ